MKHKNTITKLLSGALAVAAAASAIPAIGAQAAMEQQLVGYYGDIDGDMAVALSDVILLSQHLSAVKPLDDPTLPDRADLDHNGSLNAVDFTLLKRIVLGEAEAEAIYEDVWVDDPVIEPPVEELLEAPVKAVNPTLLSTGTNHLLMFVVEFPDCKFKQTYTADQIKAISFGEENTSSPYYPLESVIGYYRRSSYGALEMDAEVYSYTAQNSIHSYVGNTDALIEEIMSAFDSQLDYNNYDVNHDGTMDTILLSLADNASDDDWWPCSGGYYGRKTFDGVRAGNVILGNSSPSDVENYNNTWIHELGHAMGLPDYYKYENTQDGYYGLNGDAGWEMMDDALGDMSAFSKLMYGWYTESQVQIYTGGTQTYTLQSSQVAPNCILIPRGDLNGYLSEYMVLEYATHEGNNATWWLFDDRNSGLRVIHANAEIWNGYWGPEFKWNNYGQNYDSSNQRQRVVRLVNEAEGGGFFKAGSAVNNSISGFRWYDSNGYQTVDTGVTITVDSITDGVLTLTISQN